jgi:hypothetical protein
MLVFCSEPASILYVYMYIHLYTYIHTHIHTYIHTWQILGATLQFSGYSEKLARVVNSPGERELYRTRPLIIGLCAVHMFSLLFYFPMRVHTQEQTHGAKSDMRFRNRPCGQPTTLLKFCPNIMMHRRCLQTNLHTHKYITCAQGRA